METGESRVESIFFAALQKESPEERAAYLDEACAGDEDLRRRVEALLGAHPRLGSFLKGHAAELVATEDMPPVSERPGTLIGNYKLMEQVGEGGMGVVYVAEQRQPVRRKVALKIIKPGMDTKEVIARFEAERQALAIMDHPNIAKVLDAGSTESGRPYFVMELVRGVPITDYCDQNKLTTGERLELFVTVCHAIKHAHQKGVIHRDVKPTNVMITLHDGKPVPKIIDFGVAKAINQQLTERTIYTRYAQMVGTPLYMSPEQAELSGLDVDTRTDIYSLGVLLYELLTGTTPFDKKRIRTAAYDEIRRIIREEEPPKPSTRISTLGKTATAISAHRNTDPKRLSQLIRGDLDWIVMKALEKDRTRRYETAGELAADVVRHLNHEPILAGRPSAVYRFRKFARRHKAAMATVGLVAAALLLGLIASTWQAIRATRAEVGARDERDRAVFAWKQADQQRDRAFKAEQTASRDRDRAMEAERVATQERDLAQKQRDENRRLLYVSDMNVAHQAWEAANAGRVLELLNRHRPEPGQEDLRGFEWYYLWRLCQRGLMTPTLEHGSSVYCVAFSPDGGTLAAACHDHTVRLWRAATGELRSTLTGHRNWVYSVAFSPDGETLASGSVDRTVRLWDVANGQELHTLRGHLATVNCVAFSPDGKTAASGAADKTVNLWDVATGELRHTFTGHTSTLGSVTFSPDGRTLASGSHGGTGKLWDLATMEERATLKGAGCVAFSPDGKTVACAAFDKKTVNLWDVATGALRHTLTGHTGEVRSVAFSPDGHTLASGSRDNTVRLWNVATGQLEGTLVGHAGGVQCVTFSADGKTLASSSEDATVKLWDVAADEEPELLAGHTGGVSSVAFSRQGQLASGGRDNTVRVWDVATGELKEIFEGHTDLVLAVAFSPGGKTLASASRDKLVKLWDVANGVHLRMLEGHGSYVCSVAFSPHGDTLVSGSSDGTLRLWNVANGEQRAILRGHERSVLAAAFSPDGRAPASGSADGAVKLWNLATGKEQATLEGHTGDVWSVAFSPDARMLASGAWDTTVKLWDVATGEVKRTLKGHGGRVFCVMFSPDGKTLASAAGDRTVKLWDVASGEQRATLKGHTEWLSTVAFSPDGNTLAAAAPGGTIRLWRAAGEEEVRKATALLTLEDRARTIASADAEKQQQMLADVKAYLAAKVPEGLVQKDIFLATSTARALEESGNYELASEAYRSFAEVIAKSRDEKLCDVAKRWEGIARRLVLVGKEIRLEGTLVDGTPFDWDAYRGKVVLVQFWSTRCSPAELARLRTTYELYHDRGFDVAVISTDPDRPAVEQYLQREQMPWVTLHNKDAERGHPMAIYYGITRVPTAVLVDQEGNVVSVSARSQEFDKPLEQLLGAPYVPKGKLTHIDLKAQANRKLTGGTNNLEELPQGEQTFGGVRFLIGDSFIQLGSERLPNMPKQVEAISVNEAFTKLYVLHAARQAGDVPDGTVIGQYKVKYQDETEEMIPVVLGEDVRDWWNMDESKAITRGKVVWEGTNPAASKANRTLRLYLTMWKNPHPDKKVVSIDFISANTDAAPFCVAMTVEEAPDTSTDETASDSPSQ